MTKKAPTVQSKDKAVWVFLRVLYTDTTQEKATIVSKPAATFRNLF